MTRRILAIVDDMFFASKIRATAEAVEVEVSFPRSIDAAVEKARTTNPELILIDLHNQRFDPIAFANEVKNFPELATIPMLGFFSHVEVELQKRAFAAGIERVVPRSVFALDLGGILKGDSSL